MKISHLRPFGLLLELGSTETIQDCPFDSLQGTLQENALVIVRGAPPLERKEFLSYCESATGFQTLNWSFGAVMEMQEIPQSPNYLFSREAVPFHWDGAFHKVPDVLAFSCIEAPSECSGGETLFTHTTRIFSAASPELRTLWSQVRLKYQTAPLAHYGGSIVGPLVSNHPSSGEPILRFAEAVNTQLNPVTLEVLGVAPQQAQSLITDLTEQVYEDQFCYRHTWHKGDLLFADNHTLLHGRTAFHKDEPRHLRRIQLQRTDNA